MATATIDYAHNEIHAGSHFTFDSYLSLTKAGSGQLLIITPNTTKWSHLFIEIDTTAGDVVMEFTENATVTEVGTAATIYNNSRNSTTTNGTLIYLSSTVTAGTTVLKKKYMGSGKSGYGGVNRNEDEIILKQGTNYLLKFTEQNIAACQVNFILEWYEHTNKL
jgi:hypothetical protein